MKIDRGVLQYFIIVSLMWSGVIMASLLWNISQEKKSMRVLAKKDAIANFNKDQAFRFWASKHGGVYVKKNERTLPNPNLAHIPERDINTSSGTELTLMNPAYMVRQLMHEFPIDYGIKGRIVSDKPLYKPNAPDEWEAKAIEEFKKGEKEKFEFTTYDHEPYLRLMRPMITAESCLKCHAFQGYKKGDVRGGVGVMVKMDPYIKDFNQNSLRLIFSHAVIYLVGFIMIVFGAFNINRYLIRLKEVHDNVEQSRKELELKVKERTCELEVANEKLQELDKLKSMFVASMSHELRTPLNSIIGFTGVLLQEMSGELNEKQKDQLTRVKKAGQHLLSLISDVIDISKIEAGRVEANIEEFLISEIVNDAKDEIEVLSKPKGLSIVIDMPEELKIKSDKRRLYQCVLNYLSNAVKFTEKSGIIVLKVQSVDDTIKISVTDRGVGIAKEQQGRLFEAFERLETHLRVKSGGTGLGLYLTRKIIQDLLKGSVWVKSEEGKGSTFGLTIPKTIE